MADDWNRVHPGVDLSAHYLALRILRTSRILQALLEDVVARHGFTVRGDFEVLTTLRRSARGAIQPSDLARALMITTAGITGRLDRLESAGLVSRQSHPSDRRAIVVEITKKGRRVAEAVFSDALEAEDAMFATISRDDRTRLADLLRDVLTRSGDTPSGAEA